MAKPRFGLAHAAVVLPRPATPVHPQQKVVAPARPSAPTAAAPIDPSSSRAASPVAAPARPSAPIVRSRATSAPDLMPYDQVAVDYGAAPEADAALTALIGRLRAAIAQNEIAPITGILADDLLVVDCDNDATRACPALQPGKKRLRPTPIARLEPKQRLLQGLCCSDMRPRDVPGQFRVDATLELLRSAIAGDSLGKDPDVPGAVCAPARPMFDRDKAVKMSIAADTDPQNLRLTSREVVLRKAPRADAPESARIAADQVAPMVTDLPAPLPDGWTAVALPDGTLGYTGVGSLGDLVADSACFTKNAEGQWRIHAVIRRHPWGGPG